MSDQQPITDNLSLSDGDMFSSSRQTLTIPVNIVGTMGKGLAYQAKHQFPDINAVYQDACRKKLLQMGKPYLYKQEASLPNGIKWSLLFATKRHWRENSDLKGIEEGLRWIVENHEAEGIKSIALPALGCGLGKLEWEVVGPLMCQYLVQLRIPVTIYLPKEQKIPDNFLSPNYLLGRDSN